MLHRMPRKHRLVNSSPDSRYLAGPAGIDWRMPSGILNAVRSEWETEFGDFRRDCRARRGEGDNNET